MMLLRRLLPRQGLSGHVYCGTLRPSNTSMNFHSKPSNLYDNNGRSNVCDDDTFDAESRKRIEIYKLEMSVMHHSGMLVCDPLTLSHKECEQILSFTSASARKRYYKYLYQVNVREAAKEASLAAKKKTNQLNKEAAEECWTQNRHIIYGLSHTALLMRLRKESMQRARDWRIMLEKVYGGQQIVFDCVYDGQMSNHVCRYTAEELAECHRVNQLNLNPFDLHICAPNMDTQTMTQLRKRLPKLMHPTCPIDIHTKPITDVFPVENLVYLTSQSVNVLKHYNPDDIYVIGGAVEKCINQPASLSRAKALGIRTARFPLEEILHWGLARKEIRLDLQLKILLDFKNSGDWKEAITHIPKKYLHDK